MNYKETVFLPRTDFPMRAGLPKKEPEILEGWKRIDIYNRLREARADADRGHSQVQNRVKTDLAEVLLCDGVMEPK